MTKPAIRRSISPYQVAMSAPKHRSTTLHAIASAALGPDFTCRDCHGFERVVTRRGIAVCSNPTHGENKPQLPLRPTPHERDGRQDTPEPARPHSRVALLAG